MKPNTLNIAPLISEFVSQSELSGIRLDHESIALVSRFMKKSCEYGFKYGRSNGTSDNGV